MRRRAVLLDARQSSSLRQPLAVLIVEILINHLYPVACLLTGIALCGTALAAPANPPAKPPAYRPAAALKALDGVYRSPQPEDWGHGTFGVRDFRFDHGRWSLRFTLALDPALQHQVFEFRTHGHYQVQKASAAVPGAYETRFVEDQKFVTLLTDDAKLIEGFGLAGCALVPGQEKDISGSGCALWKPVALCSEDYDLLALDSTGGLYFGVRPADNDLCTPDKRPQALLPAVRKPA